MSKTKKWLIIAVSCFLLLILVYTFFPARIIPEKYSSVIADYVLLDGEEITINEEQTSSLVQVLKHYKTYQNYKYNILEYQKYDPEIYIVLLFQDEYGINKTGVALCFSNEHQFVHSTKYLGTLYRQVYSGKDLKDKIMQIILQNDSQP